MDWLTPEVLSMILGFVVPFVTSFLKDSNWSLPVKTLLCGAVSAVAAAASLLMTGEVTWANFAVNLPIVFASATAFYNLKFKDSLINKKLSETKVL